MPLVAVASDGLLVAVERLVDGQVQGDDGIAAHRGLQGVSVDTAFHVRLSMPCKLVAGYNLLRTIKDIINGQVQRHNTVTTHQRL